MKEKRKRKGLSIVKVDGGLKMKSSILKKIKSKINEERKIRERERKKKKKKKKEYMHFAVNRSPFLAFAFP